jgi:hypothetical protein
MHSDSRSINTQHPHTVGKTYVQSSTITNAGLGLFTSVHIQNRERFLLYNGVRRHLRDLQSRFRPNDLCEYWIRIGKSNMYIDATDPELSTNARYANECMAHNIQQHGPNGVNAIFVQDSCQNVWMQSTRHISPHEEIFVSYGDNFHIPGDDGYG